MEAKGTPNGALLDDVYKLAKALQRAAEEHGRPNSFSPGELVAYGGPRALSAGRIGRRWMGMLYSVLGGREKWGSAPVYAEDTRRFYV